MSAHLLWTDHVRLYFGKFGFDRSLNFYMGLACQRTISIAGALSGGVL